MKPQTFFRLAILFPYLLWIICAVIVAILSTSSQETSSTWNVILMPIFFYAFGILLWFIPYTILAIGMWIWSKDKTTMALYKLALTAPIFLFILMLFEVVVIYQPAKTTVELTADLPSQAVMLGGFSLFFGYLCVGVALGIFKFLKSRNVVSEEVLSTGLSPNES